jgi:hypothetical protein
MPATKKLPHADGVVCLSFEMKNSLKKFLEKFSLN